MTSHEEERRKLDEEEQRSNERNPMSAVFWKMRGLSRPKSLDEVKLRGFQILHDEDLQRIDRLRQGREHPEPVDLNKIATTGGTTEGHTPTTKGPITVDEGTTSVARSADRPEFDEKDLAEERERLRREQLDRPGRNIRGDKMKHGQEAKLEEKVLHGRDERVLWQGEGPSLRAQRRSSLPVPPEDLQDIIRTAESDLNKPRLQEQETSTVTGDVDVASALTDELRAMGIGETQVGRGSGQRDLDRDLYSSHGGTSKGRGEEGERFVRPSKEGGYRWKGRPERDEEWDLGFREGDRMKMRQDTIALQGEDIVFPPPEEGTEPVVTTDERAKERRVPASDVGMRVDHRRDVPPKQYAGARSPKEVKHRLEEARSNATSSSPPSSKTSPPSTTEPTMVPVTAETTERKKTAKIEKKLRKEQKREEAKRDMKSSDRKDETVMKKDDTGLAGDKTPKKNLVDVGPGGGGDTRSRGQLH